MAQSYGMSQYIVDLKRIAAASSDENEIFTKLGPLAQRVAADGSWIEERFFKPDPETGFSAYLLHEEEDHTLAVLAISWVPGMGIDPHDHGTWAVVVGVDGEERNTRFKRIDEGADPKYAELEVKGEMVAGPGDLVLIKEGGIHAVNNDSDKVTLSLHTYGKHINNTLRSRFDLEAHTATEFKVPIK